MLPRVSDAERRVADDWALQPDYLPTGPAPYLVWPPQPVEAVKYTLKNHLSLNDRTLYIALAIVVAFWLQPIDAGQATLSAGWIGWLLARNVALAGVIIGGLHWWFYIRRGQGDERRWDTRPLGRNKRRFAFGDQVKDNMAFTLLSGIPIASAWEVWVRWMVANGHVSTVDPGDNPVWFVLAFLVMPVWQSLHFYVIHRAMHHESIYQAVHAVHHRNVNVGPWSGLSMHPLEHLVYFSTLAVVLVLPLHLAHVLFLLFWQMLGAPSSHSGYEGVVVNEKMVLSVDGYFHQMHHRYIRCNYGSAEFPLDYWLGTAHDGTDEGAARLRSRHR